MWQLREHRVCEDFDAAGTDEYRAWREADTGLALVRMFRTEFDRWTDPDAAEPDKLGTIMVVWELVESDCECGADPADGSDECMCDGIAEALDKELRYWDVWADSIWEPSQFPDWKDASVDQVWVSAYEQYGFGSPGADTRYEYSLHVEGVSTEVREQVFGAVGVQ